MKKTLLLMVLAVTLVSGFIAAPSWAGPVSAAYDLSGAIAEAIYQTPLGTGKGQIDPGAPQGFARIPGAPRINYIAAVLWAVWVGWIFSTVGAFGGIMAGVGHITIFGLGDYAKSFKETNPLLNKLLTDTIRASNQYLVGLASLISVVNFYRMKRLVLPLGLALGTGSVAGALLIPWLTAGRISLSAYIGYFGMAVLVIGAFIFYSTTKKGQEGQKKTKEASASFQRAIKGKASESEQGVHVTKLGLKEVRFTFFGTEFSFNPFIPLVGGFFIAALSSFLGIGGGFLYVPFMTSVVGLPMFLVAGTSALAVLLSMVMSIFSYVAIKGTFISWSLVGVEMIGIFIGAMIGPRTQKYIPDIWLKRLFVVLAIYVGIRYMSKGFFGASWLPPF
jgi:uncharacterized membrane protein YfcA